VSEKPLTRKTSHQNMDWSKPEQLPSCIVFSLYRQAPKTPRNIMHMN